MVDSEGREVDAEHFEKTNITRKIGICHSHMKVGAGSCPIILSIKSKLYMPIIHQINLNYICKSSIKFALCMYVSSHLFWDYQELVILAVTALAVLISQV